MERQYIKIKDTKGNINLWEIIGKNYNGNYVVVTRHSVCEIHGTDIFINNSCILETSEDIIFDIEDCESDEFEIDSYDLDIHMIEYIQKGIFTGNRLIDELDPDLYMLYVRK